MNEQPIHPLLKGSPIEDDHAHDHPHDDGHSHEHKHGRHGHHAHEHGHQHGHDHHDAAAVDVAVMKNFVEVVKSNNKGGREMWFHPDNLKGHNQGILFFIETIHQLSSPVDCFENNAEFREAIKELRDPTNGGIDCIRLRYGRKASRAFAHAYVLKYAPEEGCYYTIQTMADFASIDRGFHWKNYDLFEDEIPPLNDDGV